MRLIDADALIAEMCKWLSIRDDEQRELVNIDDIACCVIDEVNAQSTAFDLEKVMKGLHEEQEVWLRGYNQTLAMGLEHLWRNLSGRAFGVARAIDIVENEIARREEK